ncbi:hypothetical protein ONZ45_g11973 [Pleurotus djamor]|nr:hypothetical protein ONZ45_g11973 [Pleurotus djamor]
MSTTSSASIPRSTASLHSRSTSATSVSGPTSFSITSSIFQSGTRSRAGSNIIPEAVEEEEEGSDDEGMAIDNTETPVRPRNGKGQSSGSVVLGKASASSFPPVLPFATHQPLSSVKVPPFVTESPEDPFSPIISFIIDKADAGRMDASTAQQLTGFLVNVRRTTILSSSETESASVIRDQLLEERRNLALLRDSYEQLKAEVELGLTRSNQASHGIPYTQMRAQSNTPSISPSDSISQGISVLANEDNHHAVLEGSVSNAWNAPPPIASNLLHSVTYEQLEQQTFAPFDCPRQPYPGLDFKATLWTPKDARQARGATNIYRRPLDQVLIQPNGSRPHSNVSCAMADAIIAEADVLAGLLWKHAELQFSPHTHTFGVKFFEASMFSAAWKGSIAFLEARFPILKVCIDGWKAKCALSKSLTKLRREHGCPPDADDDDDDVNPPTSSQSDSTSQKSKRSKPRSARVVKVKQTAAPVATTVFSPMRSQTKRQGTHDISTPTRLPPPTKRMKAPHRTPANAQVDAPTQPTDRDEPPLDEPTVLKLAAAAGLETQPPHPGPPSNPTGKFVDIKSLIIPAASFTSLQSWLSLQSDSVPDDTLEKMMSIVNAMATDPRHQSKTPSPYARRLADLLANLDPNSPDLDDENENNAQFGHSAYSGEWRKATETWNSIGSTSMALELLAGGLRVAIIAAQICLERHVNFTVPALCHIYLDQLVDQITTAWTISGGAAPQMSAQTTASDPTPQASSQTQSTSGATRKAKSKPLPTYVFDGKVFSVHEGLSAIGTLNKKDFIPLLENYSVPVTSEMKKDCFRKLVNEVFIAADEAMRASMRVKIDELVANRLEERALKKK